MSSYWENANVEDWVEFEEQLKIICDLNGSAEKYYNTEGIKVISVDEKCGIQALERAAPDLPATTKYNRKREFNYIRHGTLTVMAGLEVATGRVYNQIGPTRTEEDFVDFIEYILQDSGSTRFYFILDQLNTHKSESLVRLAKRVNDDHQDLGIKGKSGVLKNMKTRMTYLTNTRGKVQFAYTPKHCSWLNLVEVWFSQLSKRVLNTASFKSMDDLASRIISYLKYYNKNLAKKFKWSATKEEDRKTIVRKIKKYLQCEI